MITFENKDCMEAMKEFPDKFFDLAIVDPPYGGANSDIDGGKRFGERFDKYKCERTGGGWASKFGTKIVSWDIAPSKEYFDELFRVSKNQVVWGGNYFPLPPTRCFVVWRKTNIPSQGFTMLPVEYAWTSFNENASIYEYKSTRDKTSGKFHPTEKPINLYEWTLSKYAKEGDKILDTHVGSASSLIACYNMGFDVWGYEIDKTYYELAQKRIEEEQAQVRMDILWEE